MPIDVYSGTPGSGKSLNAVKLILQRMLFGQRTITNFEIVPPKGYKNSRQPIFWDNSQMTLKNIINFARKFHYRNIKGGYPEHQTLVIIDEAQLFFDKDFLTPKTRRQWKYFFTQHRKLGFDFLLITQHVSMLDTSIRNLLERETSHFKFENAPSTNFLMLLFYWICRGLGITLFFAVTGWVHNDRKMFRSRKFFHYRAWLANCYNTSNMFGVDLDEFIRELEAEDEDIKPKRRAGKRFEPPANEQPELEPQPEQTREFTPLRDWQSTQWGVKLTSVVNEETSA